MLDFRSMTPVNATSAIFGVALALVATPGCPRKSTETPTLSTSRGVVAADHGVASDVGARALADGGNAVDAAVATALALGVVNPASSGIGGGGFAIVYIASERAVFAVDFREVAPAALDPGDFRDATGAVVPVRARRGGLAIGVPGEIAGLHYLIEKWGRKSWADAVRPAFRLADGGYDVSPWFDRVADKVRDKVGDSPHYAALRAMVDDDATRAGARARRPELAATLAALAGGGPDVFYRGAIADDVIAAVTAAGGVMTRDDLAAYAVAQREPLWGTWRGRRIATMPLPSSGGLVLLEAFGILDASGIDLAALGFGTGASQHVIAELLKHGFADRARWLGDTANAAAAASRLLDPARLARLATEIDRERTRPAIEYGDTLPAPDADDGGTSHVCVIDGDGNAVALSSTVNDFFGSHVVTAGGIVLNDEVDDFALAENQPNLFGLIQSAENLVGAGKRPLSSMTPVLVFDDAGRVVACAGGSGGPRIISATLQSLLGVLVFGVDAGTAVAAPRIHHQWLPDRLVVEKTVPAAVVDDLHRRGHVIEVLQGEAVVQLIHVRADGTRDAASDPRKGGSPAAAP
jgi:gamma-glutamyltranspeptidase/glutathione hydrolase